MAQKQSIPMQRKAVPSQYPKQSPQSFIFLSDEALGLSLLIGRGNGNILQILAFLFWGSSPQKAEFAPETAVESACFYQFLHDFLFLKPAYAVPVLFSVSKGWLQIIKIVTDFVKFFS